VLSYTFFRSVPSPLQNTERVHGILICRAKRNDKGHLVPDASEDVIQKSQGFENYQLARREGNKA
jgi:hypothetical protein